MQQLMCSAARTIWLRATPLMSQTKPTPQLSCSKRGSYKPRALGIPRASSSCSALGLRLVMALLRKARRSRRPLSPSSNENRNPQRDCCRAPPKRPANVSPVPPMSTDAPSTDGSMSHRFTSNRRCACFFVLWRASASPGVLPRGGGSPSQNHSGESSRCCSATTPITTQGEMRYQYGKGRRNPARYSARRMFASTTCRYAWRAPRSSDPSRAETRPAYRA